VYTNVLLGIGFSVLNDLAIIAGYVVEVIVIFLIAQCIFRIKKQR
jgi:hypothetical protein